MNRKTFNKIKKIIYSEIKLPECKVRYKETMYGTSYFMKERIVSIDKRSHNSNISLIHGILHEVCHDLTFKPGWKKGYFGFYLNAKGKIRPHAHDRHTCEYAAEKLLRKICREYSWRELLNYSTNYIIPMWKNINIKRDPIYVPHYHYAANRIIREECI